MPPIEPCKEERKPAMDMPITSNERELWREREGDYYANSVSVTPDGALCINVGGAVICKQLAGWHSLAGPIEKHTPSSDSLRRLEEIEARLNAATAWPWKVEPEGGDDHLRSADGESLMCNTSYYPWTPDREEDWQFIASAPSDIRYLLDQLKERR